MSWADRPGTAAVPPSSRADGAAVPSPCINVCRIDAINGLCEGCARTLDEIGAWSVMSDEAKLAVWALLPARHEAAAACAAAVIANKESGS